MKFEKAYGATGEPPSLERGDIFKSEGNVFLISPRLHMVDGSAKRQGYGLVCLTTSIVGARVFDSLGEINDYVYSKYDHIQVFDGREAILQLSALKYERL